MGVAEIHAAREALDAALVQALDGPPLACRREREQPGLPERQQPVLLVPQPVQPARPPATAEQPRVAAAQRPLGRLRPPTRCLLVLLCLPAVLGLLSVKRVDHALLAVRLLAQPEQARERLQLQPVADPDQIDHQAVLLARMGP